MSRARSPPDSTATGFAVLAIGKTCVDERAERLLITCIGFGKYGVEQGAFSAEIRKYLIVVAKAAAGVERDPRGFPTGVEGLSQAAQ